MNRERVFDELDARREAMMKRAEMSKEEIARRAEDIREMFEENVDQQVVTNFAGWTLVSAGLAWGVTDWMKGKRGMSALILPIVMLAGGFAMLAGGRAWHRRTMHIDEAEARMREELFALDPFARFRILRDLADQAVPFVRNISVRN